MTTYKIEGDAPLSRYTPEQLGEPIYRPVSGRSKGNFDLIVLDGTNQVAVLENASWNVCRERVVAMVYAGVDPSDIRGVPLGESGIGALGAGLSNVESFLWWTREDQSRFDKSREA
jgi:hypothetical protein